MPTGARLAATAIPPAARPAAVVSRNGPAGPSDEAPDGTGVRPGPVATAETAPDANVATTGATGSTALALEGRVEVVVGRHVAVHAAPVGGAAAGGSAIGRLALRRAWWRGAGSNWGRP